MSAEGCGPVRSSAYSAALQACVVFTDVRNRAPLPQAADSSAAEMTEQTNGGVAAFLGAKDEH
jgi:hypothetical protein